MDELRGSRALGIVRAVMVASRRSCASCFPLGRAMPGCSEGSTGNAHADAVCKVGARDRLVEFGVTSRDPRIPHLSTTTFFVYILVGTYLQWKFCIL